MSSYYRDPDAPAPNVPRRIGVTALIERDGAFLVERRADDPDRWAFIGGGLEEDRADPRRARPRGARGNRFLDRARELLGCSRTRRESSRIPTETSAVFCRLRFASLPTGAANRFRVTSRQRMRFVPRDELVRLAFWPAHAPILEALLRQPDDSRNRMTEIGGATKLVGLIGWPVDLSLSPRMQNAAFAAAGLDWAYVPLPTHRRGSRMPSTGSWHSASSERTSRLRTSSPSPHCAGPTSHSVNTLVVRKRAGRGSVDRCGDSCGARTRKRGDHR